MDYEKAYKAVLQTAKQWIKDGCADKEKICLECVFPELRESEDERIRRTLVEYFGPKVQLDFVRGVPIQKIRDWLEKQKEQPVSAAKEALIRAGLKPYKDGNKWCILAGDNIQEGICGFGDTIDEALYQFLLEVLEKQKEQKQTDLPAGFYYIDLNGNRYYSKEFRYGDMKLKVGEQKPVLTAKEAWKEMRLEVYAQASGNRHEPNYSDDSTKMFSLCDIDEIFEKIGNSTVEQKPAWSEDIIRKAVKEIGLTQHQIDWFKTNVFPPKQEWSEEDEKMLTDISWAIRYCAYDDKKKKRVHDWFINRLESLRPPFKPSEEQMKALQHAIDACESEWAYQDDELRSLLNDLKKL